MTGYSTIDIEDGPVPTVEAGVAAGTNPTVTIVGSDVKGRVTTLTGTNTEAGLVATITFSSIDRHRSGNFYPLISPANDFAAEHVFYATRIDDFSWGLYYPGVLDSATTFTWYYHIP